ncbi:unnamed protein product [Echinostoma caproni]|uniref:RRM domain-containing protein n=1 Tax=Echinostoma caproni TaxID=27848 RepID=A0A183A6K9_9TREM|nr:unnamed protein product [Echinostoma caproni]
MQDDVGVGDMAEIGPNPGNPEIVEKGPLRTAYSFAARSAEGSESDQTIPDQHRLLKLSTDAVTRIRIKVPWPDSFEDGDMRTFLKEFTDVTQLVGSRSDQGKLTAVRALLNGRSRAVLDVERRGDGVGRRKGRLDRGIRHPGQPLAGVVELQDGAAPS